MVKRKLIKNASKIDKFLINFLKNQKKTLLVKPMKYGIISEEKNKINYNFRCWKNL